MRQADTELEQKAKIEELVHSVPRLPEIERVTISFDKDWSGDPALYLAFVVRPDVKVDEAFVDKFLDYTGAVQTKILHSGIDLFPYTWLQQAA